MDRMELKVAASKTLSFLSFLPVMIVLVVIGWGGLAVLMFTSLPTLGPRWLFFFLCVCALTGIFLPIAYFLNIRFPSRPPAGGDVVLRQALWVGVYGATLAWLQLGRLVSPGSALILAGLFALFEVLLRLWERSRWKPEEINE
jgi:hypothetical protein